MLNNISQGCLFTDDDFKELIMDAFFEKYNDPNIIPPSFNVSNGFISNFKNRHRFVSRKCHCKRRPNGNKEQIENFLNKMMELFQKIPCKTEEEESQRLYHFNADETAWEITPEDIRVWHPVGVDHVVRYANTSDKERISVVAAISANGAKLPLQFIAKGNSEACIRNQIGDVSPHYATFSKNGWTTEETFKAFLTGVRDFYGFEDESRIHLILDVYRAHFTESVREHVENLNIELIPIPAGMTDEMQPLDLRIFGPLKLYAARLFRLRLWIDPDVH